MPSPPGPAMKGRRCKYVKVNGELLAWFKKKPDFNKVYTERLFLKILGFLGRHLGPFEKCLGPGPKRFGPFEKCLGY